VRVKRLPIGVPAVPTVRRAANAVQGVVDSDVKDMAEDVTDVDRLALGASGPHLNSRLHLR